MTNDLSFKICIGDLAAYNNGFLIYTWVDLINLTWDEIIEEKNKLLKTGYRVVVEKIYDGNSSMVHPHEEWHIQDYSNPWGIAVSEYDGLEKLYDFAEKIKNIDRELISKVYEATDFTIDEVIADEINFEDYHYIEAKDAKALGEAVFTELYGEPLNLIENLRLIHDGQKSILNLMAKNFDYESYGRNLTHSGQYVKVKYGYLVHYG